MFKMIIVEDQLFIANTIAKTIQESTNDYNICGIFQNGRECLEHLDEINPQLILTDIRMPIMDGLQLSEEISVRYPYIKIILLTGYDDFNYARKAIQIGVTNYLLKPCSPVELIDALDKAAIEILKEQSTKNTISNYQDFIDNLPTFKQQALISIMYNYSKLNPKDIHSLYLSHFLDKTILCVIILDDKVTKDCSQSEMDILLFCSCNILTELLSTYNQKELFICNCQLVFFLPLAGTTSESVLSVLKEALCTAAKYLDFNLALTEVSIAEDIFHFNFAYEKAVTLQSCINDSTNINDTDLVESKKLSSKDSLNAAITYIKTHYHEDLSLQDVADNIFISYNYLSSIFTQYLGMNFSTYLTKIRIEKACELLKIPHLKVSEIAEMIGYSNYRYFTHVFKKMTNYTPTDYRKTYCTQYYK